MSHKSLGTEPPAVVCARMENVPATDSFAERPVRIAETARQSSNPRGAKSGERNRPRQARMLSRLSDVIARLGVKFCRIQMTADAIRITVNALRRKPRLFCSTSRKIVFARGIW